jgi:hypothetical protein
MLYLSSSVKRLISIEYDGVTIVECGCLVGLSVSRNNFLGYAGKYIRWTRSHLLNQDVLEPIQWGIISLKPRQIWKNIFAVSHDLNDKMKDDTSAIKKKESNDRFKDLSKNQNRKHIGWAVSLAPGLRLLNLLLPLVVPVSISIRGTSEVDIDLRLTGLPKCG